VAAFSALCSARFIDSGVAIRVAGSGRLKLFDSSEDGPTSGGQSDVVSLAPGQYDVLTAQVDAGPELRLIAHKFKCADSY